MPGDVYRLGKLDPHTKSTRITTSSIRKNDINSMAQKAETTSSSTDVRSENDEDLPGIELN